MHNLEGHIILENFSVSQNVLGINLKNLLIVTEIDLGQQLTLQREL
jgi:hypothetical protein